MADLVDLCHETEDHLQGVTFDDFLESRVIQRAVERTLELIGEAARQLGDDRPPVDVPWDEIARLRVVLAHAYHKVDPRILFETAQRDVPTLRRAIEAFLGS